MIIHSHDYIYAYGHSNLYELYYNNRKYRNYKKTKLKSSRETVIDFRWVKQEVETEINEEKKEVTPRDEWKEYFTEKRLKNTQ